MNTLQVQGVRKTHGNKIIVDNVSFEVRDGEFFVLLGPSGSGKSTLLKLICGLDQPDAGRILLNGREITTLAPRERNLGMVFQDYGLYPNMNVYQNVAYGLEARGLPTAEIEKRVPAAAEKLGLKDLLSRGIGEISGGEQQRVALARTLVKDADAYLYDEPLSNLDPKLRHKARRDIVFVHNEKRKPSVYVTHDQTEAFAMGDRIAVLADGKLQQVGTASELLDAPQNTFVASFLGSPPINLIDGTIERGTDALYFRSSGFDLALPGLWGPTLAARPSSAVILGLRPNRVARPGSEMPMPEMHSKPITWCVRAIQALLGEVVLHVECGEQTLNVVLPDSAAEGLTEGAPLDLVVDMDYLMFFDPITRQAIGR